VQKYSPVQAQQEQSVFIELKYSAPAPTTQLTQSNLLLQRTNLRIDSIIINSFKNIDRVLNQREQRPNIAVR
jgi:hypothetical protein